MQVGHEEDRIMYEAKEWRCGLIGCKEEVRALHPLRRYLEDRGCHEIGMPIFVLILRSTKMALFQGRGQNKVC